MRCCDARALPAGWCEWTSPDAGTVPRQASFRIDPAHQVTAFRLVVAALPQLLLLLLAGARLDLLGGFNRTDAGFGVVVTLFFATPVVTAALLVVEVIRRRKLVDRDRRANASPMVALASFLLLEALALNLLILTQVRMH